MCTHPRLTTWDWITYTGACPGRNLILPPLVTIDHLQLFTEGQTLYNFSYQPWHSTWYSHFAGLVHAACYIIGISWVQFTFHDGACMQGTALMCSPVEMQSNPRFMCASHGTWVVSGPAVGMMVSLQTNFFSLEEKISLLKTHLSKHLICLNMWPYTYFPQCLWVRIPRILSVCYTGFYRALPAAMESRTNTPHLKWHQRDAILISPLPYFRSCCCDKNTDKN